MWFESICIVFMWSWDLMDLFISLKDLLCSLLTFYDILRLKIRIIIFTKPFQHDGCLVKTQKIFSVNSSVYLICMFFSLNNFDFLYFLYVCRFSLRKCPSWISEETFAWFCCCVSVHDNKQTVQRWIKASFTWTQTLNTTRLIALKSKWLLCNRFMQEDVPLTGYLSWMTDICIFHDLLPDWPFRDTFLSLTPANQEKRLIESLRL